VCRLFSCFVSFIAVSDGTQLNLDSDNVFPTAPAVTDVVVPDSLSQLWCAVPMKQKLLALLSFLSAKSKQKFVQFFFPPFFFSKFSQTSHVDA
jgi:hypothetical protein